MSDSPDNLTDSGPTETKVDGSGDLTRQQRDPNDPIAVVGLGASAGGVAVLQQFFTGMPSDSGLAFVVVMHLAPDFESNLASILQLKTSMPVIQVHEGVKVLSNHVYVIPPNKQLLFENGSLCLIEGQQRAGRRVTIDLFFRTLAQSYGHRAVSVILTGSDSDGVIGLKHVRAQGGVTVAQDPQEAEYDSMPLTAISTGMVDWVLPVAKMPAKLLEFAQNGSRLQLPPEIAEAGELDPKTMSARGGETGAEEIWTTEDESALQQVLAHLRDQTGHDFEYYKRATILRRITRRLHVNSINRLPEYLDFLQKHPAESRALLQDLLIGVTHFFRDQESFAALAANIPQLFAGKKKDDQIRVWVAGCATGEEAYSIAILLTEHAERLDAPPAIQIFATDIDKLAVREAREGLYPSTIEADVSQERLYRFFSKDHGQYRVRKDLREKVLFVVHNVLSDPPFSRLDLVSCRNLLIYLKNKAQTQAFDIFHFSLRPSGLLFIGGSETADPGSNLFTPLDSKNRLFVRLSVPVPVWKLPMLPAVAPLPGPKPTAPVDRAALPPLTRKEVEGIAPAISKTAFAAQERRTLLFGELHLKLLEQYGPPSVVVNEAHNIVHLSENAGRYLSFTAGEPSANLLKVIHPALRIELRTALFRASQTGEEVSTPHLSPEIDGATEAITLHVRPLRQSERGHVFFLVVFEQKAEGVAAPPVDSRQEAVNRELDEEVQFLKEQLNATIEQYEASNEELKASNEELQAMNEEMRSAAEELETSKEELQSVNEELSTVNHELKSNIEELSLINSDLNSLMASTDIGTIFLDRRLRVKRFTPSAQRVFNLLPADTGRPLSDITHKLAHPELIPDVLKVLNELVTIEREIQAQNGSWWLTRLAPYRAEEDRITGVVATFIDITRRKFAEDELRESEERFRQFAENSADVLWILNAKSRQLEYLSPAFDQVFGGPRESLMRNRTRWEDFLHPDDRELGLARLPSLLAGEIVSTDYRIIRPSDRATRWIRDTGFPIRNDEGAVYRVAGVAQDVTADKAHAEELRLSDERFRLLVDGARDYAIFMLNPDNRIIYWSAGAERNFGWTAEEALGRTGRLIFTPEDRENKIEEKEIQTALRKGSASDRRWHLRKDGKRIWVDGVMRRLDDENGNLRGFAKVARDATEQRAAEEELKESRAELEKRVKERTAELTTINRELAREMKQRFELEQEILLISEREKRRMGQDLHDSLCQELAAAAFFLQTSANKIGNGHSAQAKVLSEAAKIVNANVGLARDLARGLHPVELSASGLTTALRELAFRTNHDGIKCKFKCLKPVRVSNEAVALNLYRIVQEAVTNAIKNGKAKKILITLEKRRAKLVLTVVDDGRGFSVRRHGKGMGLNIMNYRAHAVGGNLAVESADGHGTKVTCTVPSS